MRPFPSRSRRARCGGFSLVEAILVLAIVSVAAAMYAQIVASSARLDPIGQETAIAVSAARDALERLRAETPERLVALYDADPANDPDGAGTGPGSTFAVAGLAPAVLGQPIGRFEFPTLDGRIAEDSVDAMLGCPRDLNADNLIDGLDHRDDWVLLPIRVRLEWTPRGGSNRTRNFELYSLVPRL